MGVDVRDAETYLAPLGVPTGLRVLGMRLGTAPVSGAATDLPADDVRLRSVPTFDLASDISSSTLLIVDPDAPERARGDGSVPGAAGPWLHLLVTGIRGGDLSTGDVVVNYARPTPPKGTHRYIALQLEETGDAIAVPTTDRKRWPLGAFLAQASVVPVAMNFYYAHHA